MLSLLKEIGWIDALSFGAIAFLVIRGFIRGCSGELGRLVAVCTAAGVGYFCFAAVSRVVLMAKLFQSNQYAGRLVVFIVMLVACLAIWLFLSRMLSEVIRLVVAQPFDAILGGIIGGIKAFILVAVLCAFGLLNPNEQERTQFKNQSFAAQMLSPLLKRITSPDS